MGGSEMIHDSSSNVIYLLSTPYVTRLLGCARVMQTVITSDKLRLYHRERETGIAGMDKGSIFLPATARSVTPVSMLLVMELKYATSVKTKIMEDIYIRTVHRCSD